MEFIYIIYIVNKLKNIFILNIIMNNNTLIIEFYDDKYIFDENMVYITCGPICFSGGKNIGDFVSTVIYHINFIIDNSRDIVLVFDESCLSIGKLFSYKIKRFLLTKNFEIINKNTNYLNLNSKA